MRLAKIAQLSWLVMLLSITPLAFAHQQTATTSAASACAQPAVKCADSMTLAVDHQGHLWRAFANGDTLYVQQRLANGQFAKVRQVSVEPYPILASGENRIELTFGADKAIYLAWAIAGKGEHASNIRFSVAADGVHFAPAVTINQTRWQTMHSFPQLAVNAKGQVFIAWLDMRSMARAMAKGLPVEHKVTADVYYNWSADGGKHFQGQDQLLKKAACLCCRMAMQLGDNGLPELFFRNVYPGTERDHALIRFSDVTTPLPPERISFDHWHLNGCPEQGPALLQVNGVTHFLWYDKGQLYYRQGYSRQELSRQGHANQQQEQLSPAFPVGKKGAEHPAMTAAKGVLYRAWRRYNDGAMRIWWQASSDHGHHWSAPKMQAKTQGRSDYPQLVSNGQQVWLSWLTKQQGAQLWNLANAKVTP